MIQKKTVIFSSFPSSTSYPAADIYRQVTRRLLASLEAGLVPWRQPWQRDEQGSPLSEWGLPYHALSGQAFSGVNVLLLWQTMQARQLRATRWLTGDDLRALGGQVKTGEKPTTVVRYKPTLSLMKVINLAQCEGLPAELQLGGPLPPEPYPSLQAVRDLVISSGVPLLHRDDVPLVGLYRPLHDRIELPGLVQYGQPANYWSTLLALLVQATGHAGCLDRFGLSVRDGDSDSLQESLIASVGAAFLGEQLRVRGQAVLPDTDPLAYWIERMQADPVAIFRASHAARQAMDYLQQRVNQRPSTVAAFQQMAGILMQHYGQRLDETDLVSEAVVRRHLQAGTRPLEAVNILADIYAWNRQDNQERALFPEPLTMASELLATLETSPGSLVYYQVSDDAETNSTEGINEQTTQLALTEAEEFARVDAQMLAEDVQQLELEQEIRVVSDIDTESPNGSVQPEDEEGEDGDAPSNVVSLPERPRNPHRAAFIALFNAMAPYENRYQVFSDFIHMSMSALYNRLLMNETFEQDYMRRVARYQPEDVTRLSQLLGEVVAGLEFEVCDFLGSIFMELGLGSKRACQYFTPDSITTMMAQVLMADGLKELDSGEKAFLTISDPACGAGGTIIAYYKAMRDAGYNPQQQLFAQCVDIDPVAGMMTYIQLSLLGLPAEIIIGNSLTVEYHQVLHTPMYFMGFWRNKLQRRWAAEEEKEEVELKEAV
ncbi:TPA: ArdC-like ssDNA-binding domain-containing protein [Serratia fonticola]